ncbi:hypothetical protein FB446DRAFT_615078, partial [Lentinula raphanica]
FSNTPFHKHHQNDLTMQKYTGELCRLVCFVLQSHTSTDYPFELPQAIKNDIEDLYEILETDDDEDPYDRIMAMQQLLLALWKYRWPVSKNTQVTTDPTMLFLAFRSIQPQGNFNDARQTTPIIAQLTYCMRLVAVLELTIGCDTDNYDFYAAWNKLAPFFTEKVDTTFNSLRSLQHFASGNAYSQMSMPRIVWTDHIHYQEMLYMGDSIKFDALRKVFAFLEKECIKLWENDLMLGTGLRVDWTEHEISDNLVDHTPNYSAFNDRRNRNCFGDGSQLAVIVLSDSGLCKRFTTGIDAATGNPVWNQLELRKYLLKYSEFQALLLLRWMMLGGSPMRGTEAVSFIFANTTTRTRNIAFVGSHLAAITMYHKSSALTHRDKLLPHAGDAVTSDLTIQDLALARPFAQLAAFICYPREKRIMEAYSTLMFVNQGRPFESEEISSLMGKITKDMMGVRLQINAFRHISIGFRR